jgi:hypothetical protein
VLKLNYTEAGLYLERIAAPLEVLVAQRVILALRAGQTLQVEPGKAAFLLPAAVDGLAQLTIALRDLNNENIAIDAVDAEFVEVSLHGTWIAASSDAEEGTFITALSDRAEFFVAKLWQISQLHLSSVL